MYTTYNRLYRKGRAISKPFRYLSNSSKQRAINITKRQNTRWNKLKMNRGFKVKLVATRKR